MVNNRKFPKEHNTLKAELRNMNMSCINKEKEGSTVKYDNKEQSPEHYFTSSKMDISKKKLHTADDDFSSQFLRPRSSTDVATLVKEDQQRVRPKERRSITLDNELSGPRNCEGLLQHQHSPMNSPLAARKFGRHLFEKRPSLPSSLPCSATNSPRFARRNSDFISSKKGGLSDEDIQRLSGSLSELEKAKQRFGRNLHEKRLSLPCSVTNSPHLARRNSEFILSKQAGLSDEDIRRLSGSLSQLVKAKPRPPPYEERPFYLCPENGSFRRNYWKSESVALEKRMEARRRKVSKVEEEKVQEERPVTEILPPFALSSIFAQESNKAKRKEVHKETKTKIRGVKKNGSNERLSVDVSTLTKDLSDCRYLRIPNKSL